MINIIEYLNDKGVQYWTSGKNVSQGWIGLQCIFCGDRSNHLGINLSSNIYSCFVCGSKGGVVKLVATLEQCSYRKAETILKDYSDGIIPQYDEKHPGLTVELPNNLHKDLQPLHKTYLERRNFPLEIYKKYRLQCFGVTGEYKFRFFIPFFYKNRMTTFTTRDVTDIQIPKYKNCPIEKSIIPVKNTLYNIDSARSVAVVVEGVTDVWRIGDGAVAIHGISCTPSQLKLLTNFQKVYIMLDSTATKEAEKIGNDLCAFTDVEILQLEKGDPAELPDSEVKKLRQKIF